jgi:hypothetical protein
MTELNLKPLNKRPLLLTILCVISFLGSGMAALSNLFIYFNHDVLLKTIEEGMLKDIGIDLSIMTNVEPIFFMISGLLNIISFTGVRHMWTLAKGRLPSLRHFSVNDADCFHLIYIQAIGSISNV